MELSECTKEYITGPDNIYDLISNCYGLLCESISNPAAFINDYLSGNSQDAENEVNPNLQILDKFAEMVMQETQKFRASRFERYITKIRLMIGGLDLKEYLDSGLNEMTVIFALLSGIDAGARSWAMNKFSAGLGPLDSNGKTGYRVYFNSHRTMHYQYVEGVGRERQQESNFASQFETFRFINTENWTFGTDGPRILHIPRISAGAEPETKLLVAVLPGLNENNFEFAKRKGNGLGISYTNTDQKKMADKIIKSLQAVIEHECDMIVLPEYVLSPCLYSIIQQEIRRAYFRRGPEHMPQLIFAGTMWTEDDNNVLKILDSCGDEIGSYYKYSPFTKNRKDGFGYEIYESLADPGKICDLVSVEGWGVFLPAICRDAIDGIYTEEIAKLLLPFFLVICAWSPSVASFGPRQDELANSYFISSILANSCSAVKMDKKIIGNAGIVEKQETIAGMHPEPLCREDCAESCESCACVYIAEYDFSFSAEKKVNTKLRVYRL